MGVRLMLRSMSLLISRFFTYQSKINLNDDDIPLNNMNWTTKQWDDGTGKLNKKQHKLGGKDNFRLGYRYKKLD